MGTGDERWKAFCEFAEHQPIDYGCGANPPLFEPWDDDIVTVKNSPRVVKNSPATRRRKPSLARAKQQAAKAGIEVARYEIGADTINVVPANANETTENPWDEVSKREAH
jgi:hypothetical protein